ncbi:MAG: SGNH/GDSL hydrolase family protein [Saprospiraceae bacterium]|nr:SGNH/GDSL hydrolase family protein [Saprospiraceae bacterium]
MIDFYKNELKALNTKDALEDSDSKSVILAMGDSFTADPNSYVRTVRNLVSKASVINSGIPGTCIREAALMASLRMRKFKPKVLLYQIYVGNDLIEFKPPYLSKNLSFTRRCYWWLSPKIQILGYINFRLRFIRQLLHAEIETDENPKIIEHFSTEHYDARTKMMFKADPQDLENCIFLKNRRESDMANYVRKLNQFLAQIPDDCLVYVIVIPHCIQLNPTYRDRMIQLGAQPRYPDQLFNVHFPFFKN